MTKGLIFDAETNNFTVLETADDSRSKLDAWYDAIGCRCIDIVSRKIHDKYFEVVLDDEGLLVENPILTAIDMIGRPMLAGTLIIYGGVNEEGELTSIADEDIESIKNGLATGVFTDGTVKKFIVMEY